MLGTIGVEYSLWALKTIQLEGSGLEINLRVLMETAEHELAVGHGSSAVMTGAGLCS